MIEAWDRCGGRSSTGPWTCGEWGSCDLAVDDSPGSMSGPFLMDADGQEMVEKTQPSCCPCDVQKQ